MSVETAISLILGSTVLGGIVGAYAQSSRQREETFRERMIERAVEFLNAVGVAQRAIIAAREARTTRSSGKDGNEDTPGFEAALGEARKAVAETWAFVPVLRVVFPDPEPAERAADLVSRMEVLVTAIASHPREDTPLQAETNGVTHAHGAYADVVNRAIRAAAFGGGMRRLVRRPRRSAP